MTLDPSFAFEIGLALLALPIKNVVAQGLELRMPFETGTVAGCTQGPGGDTSHKGDNTAEALDFAAPKGTRVVAAAGGIAHVFFDTPDPNFFDPDCPTATSRTFGNHVNIDHSNGTFTVYAHLDSFEPRIDGRD